MVVFGQKWLHSGKSGFIQAKLLYSDKVVVFGQIGCIRAKWWYSVMVVVFGQKWLYSGKYGCIRANIVVFGQI